MQRVMHVSMSPMLAMVVVMGPTSISNSKQNGGSDDGDDDDDNGDGFAF